MHYIKVSWKHELADEPILLYSELNDARMEIRKVEIFRDGQMGYAGKEGATKGTMLGTEPVPPRSKLAENPEFIPVEIAKEEFEEIWRRAVARNA